MVSPHQVVARGKEYSSSLFHPSSMSLGTALTPKHVEGYSLAFPDQCEVSSIRRCLYGLICLPVTLALLLDSSFALLEYFKLLFQWPIREAIINTKYFPKNGLMQRFTQDSHRPQLAANSPLATASLPHMCALGRTSRTDSPCLHSCIAYRCWWQVSRIHRTQWTASYSSQAPGSLSPSYPLLALKSLSRAVLLLNQNHTCTNRFVLEWVRSPSVPAYFSCLYPTHTSLHLQSNARFQSRRRSDARNIPARYPSGNDPTFPVSY